jgi:hypothetical protein
VAAAASAMWLCTAPRGCAPSAALAAGATAAESRGAPADGCMTLLPGGDGNGLVDAARSRCTPPPLLLVLPAESAQLLLPACIGRAGFRLCCRQALAHCCRAPGPCCCWRSSCCCSRCPCVAQPCSPALPAAGASSPPPPAHQWQSQQLRLAGRVGPKAARSGSQQLGPHGPAAMPSQAARGRGGPCPPPSTPCPPPPPPSTAPPPPPPPRPPRQPHLARCPPGCPGPRR